MSRDIWGRLAPKYDIDHTCITGADLVLEIQELLAQQVPHGTVIELGCGTGLYTAAYASGREVIAIDLSPPMVEVARRVLAGFQGVRVQVGDATATGLPDESADAVVATNLLHVVPDPAAVLAEARRLLRPHGELFAIDATGKGLSARQMLVGTACILRRWGPIPPRTKGQRDLDQTSLEGLVRAAGFESLTGHALTGQSMNAAYVRALAPARAEVR